MSEQSVDQMLQFFEFTHLPPKLQEVSAPFCSLAQQVCNTLPSNPERTVALRKLLEAKDCAVRALIYKEVNQCHFLLRPASVFGVKPPPS